MGQNIILPEYIEDLIYRDSWSTEEKMVLENWISENDTNRRLFLAYRRTWKMGKYAGYWKEAPIGERWERLEKKVMAGKRRKRIVKWSGIAALFVLGISVTWILGQRKEWSGQKRVIAEMNIKSGTSKAFLVLASGKKVTLGYPRTIDFSEEGIRIQGDSASVVYQEQDEYIMNDLKYNELVVPIGGEYQLCLSDGTKVYLNSMSKLKYPIRFGNDRREVVLEGEAYFEVVRDTSRPFIVYTGKLGVNVLGTGFNILAYPDDEQFEITLVTGKINVQLEGKETILQPSEQMVIQSRSLQSEVREVNVLPYIDWKNGYLNFIGIPFEQLAVKLSRWYDVDFFFTNESVKQLKFSGAFRKYDDIHYILSLIKKTTNVEFKIQERTIFINQ